MNAVKDPKTGKWFIQYRYTDWQGNRKKSTKRGFDTKRDATAWLQRFLMSQQADLNMSFADFLAIYYQDISPRIRENTLLTKKHIIRTKILPYFGNRRISDIKPADIRKWQNMLLAKGFSQTYLRTINNQLTAILNHAVTYYDLQSNPCRKAGSMGKNHADEMQFWTKDEFSQFIDVLMDKHPAYLGFKILFWTGLRIGELLALTVGDINFTEKTISVNKSCQRIQGHDVITPPKTSKSIRTVSIPAFLLVDCQDYINSIYDIRDNDRLFCFTKHYFEKEMQRGVKLSGVKRIRLHDIRHAYVKLLLKYFTIFL